LTFRYQALRAEPLANACARLFVSQCIRGTDGISAYALDPQRRLFLELRPERLNVEGGKMIHSPSSPPLGLKGAESTSTPMALQ